MKNEADALDIVQEVFVKLWNEKPLTNEQHTKAWLIVTASNACRSQLRKWWHKKRNDYSYELQNQSEAQYEEERNEILDEVLALEDKYRIPVYLHYFEGYSTIEIGHMLKISPSTIRTRLARARKLLRLSLSEDNM